MVFGKPLDTAGWEARLLEGGYVVQRAVNSPAVEDVEVDDLAAHGASGRPALRVRGCIRHRRSASAAATRGWTVRSRRRGRRTRRRFGGLTGESGPHVGRQAQQRDAAAALDQVIGLLAAAIDARRRSAASHASRPAARRRVGRPARRGRRSSAATMRPGGDDAAPRRRPASTWACSATSRRSSSGRSRQPPACGRAPSRRAPGRATIARSSVSCRSPRSVDRSASASASAASTLVSRAATSTLVRLPLTSTLFAFRPPRPGVPSPCGSYPFGGKRSHVSGTEMPHASERRLAASARRASGGGRGASGVGGREARAGRPCQTVGPDTPERRRASPGHARIPHVGGQHDHLQRRFDVAQELQRFQTSRIVDIKAEQDKAWIEVALVEPLERASHLAVCTVA